METPYQHYNNKLGVRIKYLTSDRCHEDSLQLISSRALGKRINSDTCCEKQLKRSSLGNDALILFTSLPRDWKDAITVKFGSPKREIKKSWFTQYYEADINAFNFYSAFRYGEKNEKKLDVKLIEQYTYDASVLNAVLEAKTNRTAYAKALGVSKLDIWESLSKDVNAFREVAHKLPPNKDALRRKATNYTRALRESKQSAYHTVINGRIHNSNARKVSSKDQLAMLDELIFKHTNLDNEIIATIYNAVAQNLQWKFITSGTVANRKQKKNMAAMAGRSGVKTLKNKMLMQVKRSKPTAPMYYWTLDGWTAELLYQTTTTNKKGHKVTTYHNRLTVVVVLDAYNKYPIGFAIDTHETPALIKRALQNAMQHSKELFGEFFMPYEVQADNYSIKKLTPLYQTISPNFTRTTAGNAKAKIIEPYFNQINKNYCKLLNNWSGYNVSSGSKNQPNTEYLNKIKKNFPDRAGVEKQITSIIYAERKKKGKEFANNWLNTKEEFKQILPIESYLLTFGVTTGETSKLRGEGLITSIYGQKHTFECFDVNFRHQSHLDWSIHFDEHNLDEVLAVSKCGSERFMLQSVYIQPMALADQCEADFEERKKISQFNSKITTEIIDERAENARTLEQFLDRPFLNDTLAKHLLTDSVGQHKNHRSKQRLNIHKRAEQIEVKQQKKVEKIKVKTFQDEQQAYYDNKVDINQYLED